MENKSFLKGAAVLGAAGIMVQILGAVFRIPLANIIGDEGMGYYQTAYPIYIFLLVFSTNGAPAAISKMVSERLVIGQTSAARRVFKLSFILMTALGLVASSIFFFWAAPIVDLLGNPGAYYSMVAISPALLLVPIMAVFRGYFQGRREMEPTALSQFAEQIVRVAVGLTAAFMLLPSGLEKAAAGACAGTSVGPIFGIAVLAIIYLKRKKIFDLECYNDTTPDKKDSKEIIITLAKIAVPVTLGVSILPIMNVADVTIVMRRLSEIGYSTVEASGLYGQLSGMAGAVINIPQALALSVALSLVPAIAGIKSIGDNKGMEKNISLGLRASVIIGIPCSFGLMVLAKPIMLLLFPTQAATVDTSGMCLAVLAAGVVFLAAALSMAGVMQGLDASGLAVKTLGIAFLVKIVATYILTGIESINILGAALGSTIAYVVIGFLNVRAVIKLTGFKPDLKLTVWKPFLAGVVMAVSVVLLYSISLEIAGNTLASFIAICLGAVVYFTMLIRLKAVTEEELSAMPMGTKLLRLLKKVRII